jgi:hypothetical protein
MATFVVLAVCSIVLVETEFLPLAANQSTHGIETIAVCPCRPFRPAAAPWRNRGLRTNRTLNKYNILSIDLAC